MAHRGGAGEAPENTLAAFEQAACAGVDAVELDVCSTLDGVLVVTHDESVAALPFDLLRRDRPGLPTLGEALRSLAAATPRLGVQVDVKVRGREAEIAAALVEHRLLGRSLVSSTSAECLRAFEATAPALARAIGYPYDRHAASQRAALASAVKLALAAMRLTLPLRCARLAWGAAASVVAVERRVVSAATVRSAHERGLAVHVWTVDDPDEARRLAGLGVDAIATNVPRLLAGRLQP